MTTDLERRLAQLEQEVGRQARRARLWRRLLLGAAATAVSFVAVGALADPAMPLDCQASRSSSLYCFLADAPAIASHVNSNFEQLAAWMERKIGPLAVTDPESDVTGAGGVVVVRGTGTENLAIDGDEINARSGSSPSNLFIQNGGAAGDTNINTQGGTVRLGNTIASALTIGGGTPLRRVAFGTAGHVGGLVVPSCPTVSQLPIEETIPFGVGFSTAPTVFVQPRETDGAGCTSVRLLSVTNSGFRYQSFVGGTQAGCGCLDWIAFGS